MLSAGVGDPIILLKIFNLSLQRLGSKVFEKHPKSHIVENNTRNKGKDKIVLNVLYR